MAVQGPEPAWPAPLRIQKRPSEPFDSDILIAKLEAHLHEQERKRAARQLRDAAANRAVFVPRTAAKQFASTTTPMTYGQQIDAQQRKDSANSQRRTSEPTVDVAGINPKAAQAARSIGMSDAEIIAQASQYPGRRSGSKEYTRHQDWSQNDCIVERSASNAIYRPGDASKRKDKRSSTAIMPQQGTLESSMFPHDYDMSTDHRPQPADVFESLTAPHDEAENRPSLSGTRPALKPHDRANWAQESECGDGARHILHWRPRKSSNDKKAEQEGSQPARRKSSGPGQENLVSEAVRQIKEQKSNRRKSRVIGFFKRS